MTRPSHLCRPKATSSTSCYQQPIELAKNVFGCDYRFDCEIEEKKVKGNQENHLNNWRRTANKITNGKPITAAISEQTRLATSKAVSFIRSALAPLRLSDTWLNLLDFIRRPLFIIIILHLSLRFDSLFRLIAQKRLTLC